MSGTSGTRCKKSKKVMDMKGEMDKRDKKDMRGMRTQEREGNGFIKLSMLCGPYYQLFLTCQCRAQLTIVASKKSLLPMKNACLYLS